MSDGARASPRLPDPPAWAAQLRTAGVTGTNGKTSTTLLLAAALARLHAPVAQATTVGSFLDGERLDVPATYGGFLATMRAALDRGGRFAAIELTSEALALGFARAWPCAVGVFTNLSRDHLDAHGSAEHYLASKAQLFMQLPADGAAVLNAADPASELLAEVVPGGVRVLRYAVPSRGVVGAKADLLASAVRLSWEGTEVTLAPQATFAGLPSQLQLRAIGDVYVENALAALCAALALGVTPADAAAALADAPPPSGRFELVGGPPHVVVDYAHTPDALARALTTARALCQGRLLLVVGAGGGRDKPKRPLMGEAAAAADRVLLTSDNPRDEDPAAIAAQIREGVSGHDDVAVELDRAAAIKQAIAEAEPADVVLVAGKGHESTQTIAGQTRSFSDREIAQAALAARQP